MQCIQKFRDKVKIFLKNPSDNKPICGDNTCNVWVNLTDIASQHDCA